MTAATSNRKRNAILPLTLAYVGSAFGWRTWRQWRSTGDTGIRVGRDGSPEERIAGALFATSLAAGVVAALQAPSDQRPRRRAGLALMGAGLFGTLVAQVDLGRSWRIGVDPSEETDLVTTGAFAVVRNPIFTAMSLFAIGTAVAQGTRAAQIAALSMIAGVQSQVRLIEGPTSDRPTATTTSGTSIEPVVSFRASGEQPSPRLSASTATRTAAVSAARTAGG